jgi:asparagine synthase (glutamine-hydrolysing)
MCGIWFQLFKKSQSRDIIEENIIKYSNYLSHRGPDSFGNMILDNQICLLHTRLQINGNSTPQPLHDTQNDVYLIINGEIFNWKDLEEELNFKCTSSDCEIILPLYFKYKNNLKTFFQKLNGQFSFVLVDVKNKYILVSRDRIGVTPLYIGTNDNSIVFSSELKGIPLNMSSAVFEPRKYMYFSYEQLGSLQFSDIPKKEWISFEGISGYLVPNLEKINELLTNSVRLQLKDLLFNSNCKFGVLLSGGLDSSLIASLVVKLSKEMGYTKKIKTFSIGMSKNAPDLIAAKKVADFLGTNHHEFVYDFETGINSVPDVIYSIESYDCTSVRASTPMYLLCKFIKEKFPKIKVLFSGELSDELLCYLYGSNAPNDYEFQKETIKLVSNVHLFDCLRANKTCMAHSIEARVPFTDPDFVDYILNVDPHYKRFGENLRIEKKILRDSFKGYLPDEILYRKKEQFSDGVSAYQLSENWILSIQNYTNQLYKDNFNELSENYTFNKPRNNEELHYRQIFSEKFANLTAEKNIKIWEPNWTNTYDPSGRIQEFWVFRRGID